MVSNFVYHFRYKKIFASEFVTVYSELGNLAQSWQMGFRSSSLVSNFGANRSTLVFSSSELLGVAGGGLDLRVEGWQGALLLRNLPPFISNLGTLLKVEQTRFSSSLVSNFGYHIWYKVLLRNLLPFRH